MVLFGVQGEIFLDERLGGGDADLDGLLQQKVHHLGDGLVEGRHNAVLERRLDVEEWDVGTDEDQVGVVLEGLQFNVADLVLGCGDLAWELKVKGIFWRLSFNV